jgi:predicted XRE-type DNA-binding protein
MMSDDEITIIESSGNVFADLGLPDADEALTKAELAIAVTAIVQSRKMTQVQVAEVLGIPQPKVSALLRGQLTGFSMERLMRFLTALGHNVRIIVGDEELPRGKATLTVVSGGKENVASARGKKAGSRARKTAL